MWIKQAEAMWSWQVSTSSILHWRDSMELKVSINTNSFSVLGNLDLGLISVLWFARVDSGHLVSQSVVLRSMA